MTSLAAFKRTVTPGTPVRVEAGSQPHECITGVIGETTDGSFTVIGWTDRSPAVGGQLGGRYKLDILYRWPERASYVDAIADTHLAWTNPMRSRVTLTILPEAPPE